MNHRFLLLSSLAMLLSFVSCTRSEYDPDNVNREMTLFGEELFVPIGQVGPITVKDLLSSNKSIASLLESIMKEEPNGTFYIENQDQVFAMNAFRELMDIPDPTQPYHWDIGSQSCSIASTVALLRMFNIGFMNQRLSLYATNPITAPLTLNTDIWVRCMDNSYNETYSKEYKMEDYSLRSSYSATSLFKLDLPAEVTDLVTSIEMNDLTLDLPANAKDQVRPSDDAKFSFYTTFTSNLVLSEKFSLSQAFPISKLNVPLAKFKLHKCSLAFDLENTLPLDVTIKSIKLRDEKGNEIKDVVFSSDIKIVGGKPDAATVTPVVLEVEALTGTIPDIHEVVLDLKFEYSKTAGLVPLSSAMSLSIKSASAKLFGGITLFGK
ncbi:MAG: hypothetical protein IKN00_05620 [Bacteroidales bacterium]|nr:hypothetical protein [Bacteroidales bacterium]